jgi:PLP dependent protein
MAISVARIAQNVAEIRERMAAAAARSGRRADEVRLVAVTKYVGPDAIRALVEIGCVDLGESRPQQLWERAAALADLSIRWHLIGHLQRNKARRTVPLVAMVHSADSPRLIAALDEAAGQASQPGAAHSDARPERPAGRVPILIEVNVSGEAAKHGFTPDEIGPFLPELAAYRNLEVRGLMCMAGLEGDMDAARREFAALRCLRDRLRSHFPADSALDELSMGMSGDYEVAIEEGATIVRIGSALFEGV